DEDGWELESAERRHAQHPDTFEIPSREERESLRPGALVQLLFLLTGKEGDTEYTQCERMWVNVLGARGGTYFGHLESKPVISEVLAPGLRIEFGLEHVCTIRILKTDPQHPDYQPGAEADPAAGPGSDEPVYHHRPLSYWLSALDSRDRDLQFGAID